MTFTAPPPTAAWRHREARSGFEVVFFRPTAEGYAIEGHTTAVEGAAWVVTYQIEVDAGWLTRSATVSTRTVDTVHTARLQSDGSGHWTVDGVAAPALDGCLDLDLEASAFTNSLPARRLGLDVGAGADVTAVYLRVPDGSIEVLEQSYLRRSDDGESQRYDYRAPMFDFSCELVYDRAGLVLEYPGIAIRVDAQ